MNCVVEIRAVCMKNAERDFVGIHDRSIVEPMSLPYGKFLLLGNFDQDPALLAFGDTELEA